MRHFSSATVLRGSTLQVHSNFNPTSKFTPHHLKTTPISKFGATVATPTQTLSLSHTHTHTRISLTFKFLENEETPNNSYSHLKASTITNIANNHNNNNEGESLGIQTSETHLRWSILPTCPTQQIPSKTPLAPPQNNYNYNQPEHQNSLPNQSPRSAAGMTTVGKLERNKQNKNFRWSVNSRI